MAPGNKEPIIAGKRDTNNIPGTMVAGNPALERCMERS
jgi:hypothetical protein